MTETANKSANFSFIHLAKYLEELVPLKAQKGLSNMDVVFTSIDVTSNYIVIGTNVGVTYLYNRRTGNSRKLKCDGHSFPVTFVRCLETVDLMVAMGTSEGLIIVFQISLQPNRNQIPNSSPKMKRYLITNLHSHQISCLEWSKNGMKLVSGDGDGVVGQSEMDYTKNVSKSQFILKEPYAIVQLGYLQNMILVSSLQRTLLCNLAENSTPVQVGLKDRKSLGRYGACFYSSVDNPRDVTVFASRPSCRLWKATTEGKVVETFIFKEELSEDCQMLTLNHTRKVAQSPMSKVDSQFGELHLFASGAVTWSSRKLSIIDLSDPKLIARCDQFSDIVRVATCGDELFVLERPRTVTRIACTPDQVVSIQVLPKDDFILSPLGPLHGPLKDLETIIKKGSMLTAASLLDIIRPSVNTTASDQVNSVTSVGRLLTSQRSLGGGGDSDSAEPIAQNATVDVASCTQNDNVDAAKESVTQCSAVDAVAVALPVSEEQTGSSVAEMPLTEHFESEPSRWRTNSYNDEDDSDEGILFERRTGGRKRRSPTCDREGSGTETSDSISQGTPPDEPFIWSTKLPIDTTSSPAITSQPEAFQAVPTWSTREEREKLLAGLLDLSALFPKKEEHDESNELHVYMEHPDDFMPAYCEEEVDQDPEPTESDPTEGSGDSMSSFDRKISNTFNNYEEIVGSYLGYGPPSGSSNTTSLPEVTVTRLSSLADQENVNHLPVVESVESSAESPDQPSHGYLPDTLVQPCDGVWVQHKAPGVIYSLSVCENYILCTDVKQSVFYSTFDGMGLDWRKTDYMAKQVSVSPSGRRLWRTYHNSAFVLVEPASKGPFGKKWLEIALDAVYVAVSENCVWYATQTGDVYAQDLRKVATHGRPVEMSHPVYSIAQVACTQGAVWALTVEGKLLCRASISSDCPFGKAWSDSTFHASDRPLVALAFGSLSSAWVIDDTYRVWFQSESTTKTWWQVKMSDFVYQNINPLRSLTSSLMGSLHTENLTYMMARAGQPCIASASSQGLWISLPNNQILFTNHGDIKGHHWRHHKTRQYCPDVNLMIASGVYRLAGALWLYQPGEKLYCLSSCGTTMQCVKLPETFGKATNLHCIGAAPETLWLLSDTGRVFIRKDINVSCVAGRTWEELDLTQISNHKLVHLSCGPNVVWACTHKGTILLRIGSLSAPLLKNFSPAWVSVIDENVSTAPVFTKVYVGPLDYNVWAIDAKNNVYVREGIFPELLIGLGWVQVSGIKAVSLTISEASVYALSPNSKIYKRYNISRSNYIGDYWMELPCPEVRMVSVSVDDNLWAIDVENKLIRLEICLLPVAGKEKITSDRELCQQHIDDGWEVI